MVAPRFAIKERGFSILTSLFAVALIAGTTLAALASLSPRTSARDQSAAVASSQNDDEANDTGQRIEDHIPKTTARDNRGRLFDVRYACDQYVSIPFTEAVAVRDYVKSLEQTCTP